MRISDWSSDVCSSDLACSATISRAATATTPTPSSPPPATTSASSSAGWKPSCVPCSWRSSDPHSQITQHKSPPVQILHRRLPSRLVLSVIGRKAEKEAAERLIVPSAQHFLADFDLTRCALSGPIDVHPDRDLRTNRQFQQF